MSVLVDAVDLHDYPQITLNFFSTNAERLHNWCAANDIKPGERIIIVGRSGRVRLLEHKVTGWIEVTLIEYNPLLSTQVQIFAHYERKLRGDGRSRINNCRRDVERRLQRQIEREERRKERERARRNGH